MITDSQKLGLYAQAKRCWTMFDYAIKSFSGADQANSEIYMCERRVYVAVAGGLDIEEALSQENKVWRSYAKSQAEKVAAAPKLKRGPSAGHSVISHRWVSPDLFTSKMPHIRFMVQRCLGVEVVKP